MHGWEVPCHPNRLLVRRPRHAAPGLRAGFVRSGLSPWELYLAAAGLGGYLGPVELEAAVVELAPWTAREWEITAQAADEHFRAHHLPYRVPDP